MIRPNRLVLLGLSLLMVSLVGCARHKGKRSYAYTEPSLDSGSGAIVQSGPVVKTGFATRHPLLYKPGEVYHNVGHGPITKTSAAVFVGVPAGVVGEVKQIVVGQPKRLY